MLQRLWNLFKIQNNPILRTQLSLQQVFLMTRNYLAAHVDLTVK